MTQINDLEAAHHLSTNIYKATELAGLVSSITDLMSSLENILMHTSKDFTTDDENLLTVSIAET